MVFPNSSTNNLLASAYFLNDQTGWIVGVIGTILKTTNGGENWSAQTSGTNFRLSSVNFIDINMVGCW